MKRIVATLLLLSFAVGVGAQDAPPPPLDAKHFGWMIGEWSGWSESPMGKSKDWMKCEMGLGGQFMLMHYKNESAMGTFTGMGALTIGADGNIKGVWVDSWRNISNGTGTVNGDKTKMVWDGPMGKHVRVLQRVGADKYVEETSMQGPEGEMHGKSEMTRVKK